MALTLALKPKTTTPVAAVPQDEAVKAASVYRELALEADELEAKLKIARATLLGIVTERRDAQMAGGLNESTVKIPTLDGNRVLVVYVEKYRALSDENVGALKDAFGKEYSLFCEESVDVSLRKETSLEDIEKAVGPKAYLAIQPYLTITKGVAPRKGAFANIASLFKKGASEMAGDLTQFVDACITSPQVRAK